MKKRRGTYLLMFMIAMAAAFGLGAYRSTMGDAEAVHYSINYPARGFAAGGAGVMAREGHLIVNVGNAGWLKQVLQPQELNLSSHWVKNVGTTPRRIRFEAEGMEYPLRWESNEKAWNEKTRTLDRMLAPGSTVTVDWFVTLPRPLPARDIIVDARMVVYDADTGERLTALPIRVVSSSAAAARAGDCCAQ
ncbi:MAG: hypothetical protein Q7W30_06735 [Coriobacteriia bacterium]|nr:hypothetical protein [Coriobacteriia bacterium]